MQCFCADLLDCFDDSFGVGKERMRGCQWGRSWKIRAQNFDAHSVASSLDSRGDLALPEHLEPRRILCLPLSRCDSQREIVPLVVQPEFL